MGFLGLNWATFFSQNWIIAKSIVVLGLALYQMYCWKILKELRTPKHQWTGFKLRLFNEVPVVLLLIGIFAAVFKF